MRALKICVIATLNVGVASDAAGNASAASSSTDNTVTFDNVQPTVTINQAAAQNDPTADLTGIARSARANLTLVVLVGFWLLIIADMIVKPFS